MKLYADTWARRTSQVAADLSLLAWLLAWAWLGRFVHDLTAALAVPGRRMETAGDGLADNLRQAADSAAGVPVVGEDLRTPFDGAGDAATALAEAGRDQAEAVMDLALLLGVTVFAVPAALALLVWLPLRIRFVRRATAAHRLLHEGADLDLFALRALARQPLGRLARVSDDPAGRWRAHDAAVIRDLAVVELRASGLRVPDSVGGRG